MAARRTTLAGLVPVDFEVISLADSTAVGFNSTIRGAASVLDISVETNAVRFRADGTDPETGTGVVLQKDVHYRLQGFNGTSAFKFQRAAGGTATVSVMAWRHVGGDR